MFQRSSIGKVAMENFNIFRSVGGQSALGMQGSVVLINTNLIVGKITLVWKIEAGKHARSGNLRVGKFVESGKVSRENNSLDSCSREKDVAPLFRLCLIINEQ